MALALVLLWAAYSGSAPIAAQTSPQPNFVFILADDMRYDDLAYMPKTREVLGSQGMTFSQAFVAQSLCCPSRATILRGQYPHNHKVWFNGSGANAGWGSFKAQGYDRDNLATHLDAAGYRTGIDRKSTRLNSSHANTSYAVFCLKKTHQNATSPPPLLLNNSFNIKLQNPYTLTAFTKFFS